MEMTQHPEGAAGHREHSLGIRQSCFILCGTTRVLRLLKRMPLLEARTRSAGGLSAPKSRASIIHSTVLPPQRHGSTRTTAARRRWLTCHGLHSFTLAPRALLHSLGRCHCRCRCLKNNPVVQEAGGEVRDTRHRARAPRPHPIRDVPSRHAWPVTSPRVCGSHAEAPGSACLRRRLGCLREDGTQVSSPCGGLFTHHRKSTRDQLSQEQKAETSCVNGCVRWPAGTTQKWAAGALRPHAGCSEEPWLRGSTQQHVCPEPGSETGKATSEKLCTMKTCIPACHNQGKPVGSEEDSAQPKTERTAWPHPGAAERAGMGDKSQAKSAPQLAHRVLVRPRSPGRSGAPPSDPGPTLDLLWLSAQQRTGTHRPEQPGDSPELAPRRTRLGRPERRGSWGRTEGPQPA
ncbi:unnamed protein product [Rangifer tarandus platyrhynchus]|uniref:Uncharacterized protein n=1 Tax=Rangifer tarandus platyrhynchus TaxID=3082113 RepID=A0ABN8YK47_RANTA|nr:unnamed protein product [Rangifer tarandus platyrhynchus]